MWYEVNERFLPPIIILFLGEEGFAEEAKGGALLFSFFGVSVNTTNIQMRASRIFSMKKS